jgi:hypothetical protein
MAQGGPPILNVLQQMGPGANITASTPEDPKTRDHRHRIELILVSFMIAAVAALFAAGAYIAFKASDAEIRKMGVGLLGAILTGVLGLMAGRGTK